MAIIKTLDTITPLEWLQCALSGYHLIVNFLSAVSYFMLTKISTTNLWKCQLNHCVINKKIVIMHSDLSFSLLHGSHEIIFSPKFELLNYINILKIDSTSDKIHSREDCYHHQLYVEEVNSYGAFLFYWIQKSSSFSNRSSSPLIISPF